jgi:predicted dehydrogenase
VEKPLTLQLREAEALVRLAHATDRVTAMGYVERFVPAYVDLRRRLKEAHHECITHVRTQLTFDEVVTVPWKETVAGGGGALNDIAVHHADLVRFLFDTEIVAVHARTSAERRPHDTAEVELRLANAIHVRSFFSSARPAANHLTVCAETREWRAARTPPRSTLLRRLGGVIPRVLAPRLKPGDTAFIRCFAAFARAIQSSERMSPNLEDGARGVAFLEAAQASARGSGWVELPASSARP